MLQSLLSSLPLPLCCAVQRELLTAAGRSGTGDRATVLLALKETLSEGGRAQLMALLQSQRCAAAM